MAKTAVGGEIDALDTGNFGYIVIYQAITLDGGGSQLATTVATASGSTLVAVNIGPSAVATIRNLRLQGAAGGGISGSTGIYAYGAGTINIEHCVIEGMGSVGIYIAPQDQPTGGSQVFIEDTIVRDSGGEGLFILGQPSANVHVTVSNSRFTSNGTYGLVASDYSRVTVHNSEASGNGQAGFLALANNGNTILSMIDSVATNNLAGGVIAGGGSGTSTIRIANMGVFNNVSGYSTGTNGSIVSFGNNNNSGSGTPNGSIPQD
jgi:hypothetical protein